MYVIAILISTVSQGQRKCLEKAHSVHFFTTIKVIRIEP